MNSTMKTRLLKYYATLIQPLNRAKNKSFTGFWQREYCYNSEEHKLHHKPLVDLLVRANVGYQGSRACQGSQDAPYQVQR